MKFKCFGVSVTLNFSFFALLVFVSVGNKSIHLLPAMLFSLLHECGHFCALAVFKEYTSCLKIGFFGGEIVRRGYCGNYYKEVIINLAGPLVNIVAAVLCSLFCRKTLFYVNVAIGLFNLLPIETLDGGRALCAILCTKKDRCFVETAVTVISYCVCVPMIILSFALLFHNMGNIQLCFVSVYILLSLIFKK